MKETDLGGLRVRIAGGTDRQGGGTGPVVVLLHGFGAPGDDLAALWRVMNVPPGTRFVFPEAPLSLGPAYGGGRAWWNIDMVRLQLALQAGKTRDLSEEIPDGLAAAREALVGMLGKLQVALHPSHVILGGFSQGAMLACDVALRTDLRIDGLVLLSGSLIGAPEWTPLISKRAGLRVLQSHGREDPVLPFSLAERLRDLLREGGLDVTWVPFNGGHGIPPGVLDDLGKFVTLISEGVSGGVSAG